MGYTGRHRGPRPVTLRPSTLAGVGAAVLVVGAILGVGRLAGDPPSSVSLHLVHPASGTVLAEVAPQAADAGPPPTTAAGVLPAGSTPTPGLDVPDGRSRVYGPASPAARASTGARPAAGATAPTPTSPSARTSPSPAATTAAPTTTTRTTPVTTAPTTPFTTPPTTTTAPAPTTAPTTTTSATVPTVAPPTTTTASQPPATSTTSRTTTDVPTAPATSGATRAPAGTGTTP